MRPPESSPDRWTILAASLRNPDLELDGETFADIWRAYIVEKRLGRTFCPVLVAVLLMLQRQVMRSDDGAEVFDVPAESFPLRAAFGQVKGVA